MYAGNSEEITVKTGGNLQVKNRVSDPESGFYIRENDKIKRPTCMVVRLLTIFAVFKVC